MAGSVLVVDDEVDILVVVQETLQDEGFAVTTARNGQEALAQIERAVPALLVLDLRMPVLDGRGLARELHARGLSIPIVVMSAERRVRQGAEDIHAADYLAKPFTLEALIATVRRFLPPAP